MPDFCAAYGCSNERSVKTRSRGITFHRFPKDSSQKRQWELAVKRKGFVAAGRSLLCSDHFKPGDFDRTGQTVRLRHGVKPSVFNFPSRSQKQVPSRTTKASRKAEESLPVDVPQHFPEAEPHSNVQVPSRTTKASRKAEESLPVDVPQHFPEAEPHSNVQVLSRTTKASRKAEESLPVDVPQHFPQAKPHSKADHSYALPASPDALKAKLSEALARVESLEHQKRNCMARERRARKYVHTLLEYLRDKNLINEELNDRLECCSDGDRRRTLLT